MSDDRCWECGGIVTGDFSHKCPGETSRSPGCYNPMEKQMSQVEKIIKGIEQADEIEIMEYDFEPCFRLMREMEDAMTTFVKRVEAGEVRSTKTYAQFKAILGL